MQKDQLIEKVITILYSGALGTLGGIANMLYRHAKGEEFKLMQQLMSLALSFLVSWMIGEFLPQNFEFRDGILGVAGAVSMTVMSVIQLYGVKLIEKTTPLGKIIEEAEKVELSQKDNK